MHMIKSYSSFRSINANIDKSEWSEEWHSNHKVNGASKGFSACYKHNITGCYVYLCTDMLPSSYGTILIRSMRHPKDYTGGHNMYAKTFEEMQSIMRRLS